MYKIGDFSSMSKTTIKTLRYYEKEGLLTPVYIDQNTGYRYYESSQLIDISKIISLRQIGLSIKEIKKVLDGYDMKEILNNRKNEIEKNIKNYNIELSKINYLLEEKEVLQTFSLVHNYLDPDGLFIFDVNSPRKFEKVYSDNAYILEDENDEGSAIFCGWQNQYDKETGICDFYLTLFEEDEEGAYIRSDEHQRERCYTMEQIRSALDKANLEFISVFADYDFKEISDEDDRWYIVARAKK